MSRLRRQDNRGWIDEGPRTPNPGAVAWPLTAHEGPSARNRAAARDMEERSNYGLGRDSIASSGAATVRP